jgi:subtilisin-like proprotein convertase family protein
MRKTALLFLSVLLALGIQAQTVLLNPAGDGGFENGSDFTSNGWTLVNHTTNQWYVGAPGMNSGASGAYISSDGGVTNGYTNTISQTSHFYRDIALPSGKNIVVRFDWRGSGESSYDRLLVYIAPTSVTPVAGVPASSSTVLTGATLLGMYNLQTTWQLNATIPVGNSYSGSTMRFIFCWQNDGSGGTQPPISIDNISLLAYDPLVGNLTIKTSGGDYNSFTAAVNDLNLKGAGAGGVTFNVDAGFTSTEDVPAIVATGTAANPIVFQKSGAGANPVITATWGAGTTDAGITIYGGDYITFDGIDINVSGTAVEYGYYIRNNTATDGAQFNSIKNCKIILNRSNTSSRALYQNVVVTPTAASGANSDNKYQNIVVENAYQGIYCLGNSTYPDLNTEISGCTIGAATPNDIGNGTSTLNGIRTSSQSSQKIFNNEVRNLTITGAATIYGIFLESSRGANDVYNNKVYDIVSTSTSTSSMVYGLRVDVNSSFSANVYNNIVYGLYHGATTASATQVIRGLAANVSGSGLNNIYHNSVRIDENEFPTSTAFYTVNSGVSIINNIFANYSTAGATSLRFCLYAGATLTTSSNNILYITAGTNNHVGYAGSANRTTLGAFAGAASPAAPSYGFEGGSSAFNPNFTSLTDLSFAGATPAALSGMALASITTDINGNPRDAQRPTIGAYETAQPQNDKSAPVFSGLSVTSGAAPVVSININDKSNALNNATVQLWYRVQGSATAFTGIDADVKPAGSMNGIYTWNASLALLPNANYEYYIMARDNQGAGSGIWAYPMWKNTFTGFNPADPPNFDANPDADANVVTFTKTGLFTAGTYTIGTGENYPTLYAAANDISNKQISGPVVFELTSNYQGNNETFPILFTNIYGTSAVNDVKVYPAAGVTGRLTTGDPGSNVVMINFDNADYITFDGRPGGTGATSEWTIRNTRAATTYAATLQFINDATYNSMRYLTLESQNQNTSSGTILLSTSNVAGGIGNDFNTIANCKIRDRSDVTATMNNAIYSNGTSGRENSDINIINNEIFNFTTSGIWVSGTGNGSNWNISNNSFYNNIVSTVAQYAVYFLPGTASVNNNISGNYIGGTAPLCGGTAWTNNTTSGFYGIYISAGTTTPTTVNGNTMQNLLFSNTGSQALYLNYFTGGAINFGTSSGNIIGHISTPGSITVAGTGTVYSIYSTNAGITNIENNIVANISQSSTGSAGTFYGMYISGNADKNVRRNYIHSCGPTSLSTGTSNITGIYLAGSSGGSMTYSFVNNMISLGHGITNNHSYRGIDDFAFTGNNFNLFYNSISIGGNSSGSSVSYAFLKRDATHETHRNNVYANFRSGSSNGYAIGAINTGGSFKSNYNDLYSLSVNVGIWGTIDQSNLAAWKAASTQDTNSVSGDPLFTTATDLHANSAQINNVGIPVAGITTDFDGDLRSLTTPDMGADEFSPPQDDAGITAISPTSFCPGLTNISASIRNYGASTLTSATVQWTVNGVPQTPYAWTGSLASGQTSAPFVIGAVNIVPPGPYNFVVYSVNPNGFPDVNASNDTTKLLNITTGLAGTYTVGAGGNYLTLTAAAAAFNSTGLCGDVIFELTDATYTTPAETFPINFNHSTSSGPGATVTIRPAAGASPVVSGSAASAIIRFNGADYFTIDGSNNGSNSRDLTIRNTATTATSAAVWISSLGTGAGAVKNTIKNCNIQTGANNVSTYGITAGAGIGAAGNDNDSLTLLNNAISKAMYGIYVAATATGVNDALNISSNLIGSNTLSDYIGHSGITVIQANNGVIDANRVFNIITTSSTPVGISVGTGVTGFTVSNNNISRIEYTGTAGYGGRGIFCNTGVASSNISIYNNMISSIKGDGWTTFSGSSMVGMYIDGTTGGLNIDYNSVSLTGDFSRSSATLTAAMLFNTNTITGVNLRNNVFHNGMDNTLMTTDKNYAIYSTAPATAFTSIDYNDYYANGPQGILGYLGADINTLSGWQTASTKDSNSISADPVFVSTTDLHSYSLTLNNNAKPLPGITTDIDGQSRDALTPDIGADEFLLLANDAGINQIAQFQICPGTENIIGTIRNYGTSTLDSVVVNWTVNGVPQTPYFWYGSLSAGATTSPIIFGSYNFVAPGPYNIAAYTTQPNGTPDLNNVNDTAFWLNIITGPAGTYTVGAGGNYPTLTAAATQLNAQGICGPVVIELTASYSSAGETFPIVFNQIAGSSPVNTITIRPASGASPVISGTSTNAIIKLNGADYFIIDGSNNGTDSRDMSIINNSTSSTTAALWIASIGAGAGARKNEVKNCILKTGSITATTYGISVSGTSIGSTGFDNDSVSLINNEISKAYYGIYAGSGSTGVNDMLVISDNIIGSVTATDYVTIKGIYVTGAASPLISGNNIFNMVSAISLNTAAIEIIDYVTNAVISKNIISNVQNNSTSGYGAYGINIQPSSGGTNGVVISNNIISRINTTNYSTTSTSWNPFGIRITGGTNHEVYFNSVHLFGPQFSAGTTGTLSAAMMITSSTVSGSEIKNNIFANGLAGLAGSKSYAIYCPSGTTFADIDNNDYWAYGTYGVLGYHGSDRTTLSAWQGITGQDASSISANPGFVSNTDLHIQQLFGSVNAKATPIAGITDDIDGDIRNISTPDMGADEYSPYTDNLAMISLAAPLSSTCYSSAETVSVIISNQGSDTAFFNLSPMNITVDVSGTFPQTLTATVNSGNLAPGQSSTFVITSSFDMSLPGTYTFDAWYAWAPDMYNGNDSLSVQPTRISYNPTIDSIVYTDNQCAGVGVTLNTYTSVYGPGVPVNFIKSENPPLAIPDNDIVTGVTSSLAVSGISGAANSIVSVTIDSLLHTWAADVDIYLVAPDGSMVELSTDNGSSGDHYLGTVFSMSASTAITAGTPPFTGTFLPEGNFSTFTGSANGTWQLRVFDDEAAITGTLHRWTISFQGANSIVSYSWSPAAGLDNPAVQNPVATPANTTTYTLTATDYRGCSDTASVTVVVKPLPVVTVTATPDTICYGSQTQVEVAFTGTGPWLLQGLTKLEQGGTPQVLNDTLMLTSPWTVSDTPDTNTNYSLIAVTDVGNGCTTTGIASADVFVHLLPTAVFTGTTSICAGESTDLTITPAGAAPWTYTLSDDGGITSFTQTSSAVPFTLQVQPASNTVYSLISVSDNNGCSNNINQDVTITVKPLPVVNLGNDQSLCSYDSYTFDAGNSGAAYDWFDNSSAQTYTADFSVLGAGTHSLWVDVDLNGCVVSDTVLVTFFELPTANVSGDSAICYGSNGNLVITLTGASPWVFVGTDDNGLTYDTITVNSSPDIATVNPQTTTTYTMVELTDNNGCVNSSPGASHTIIVKPLPVVSLGSDTTLCPGQTLLLDAQNNGGSYLWTDNSTSHTLLVDYADYGTGTHTIGVTVTVDGCSSSDDLDVTYAAAPVVTLGNDTIICAGSSIFLTAANPGATYLWSTGAQTQSITIDSTGYGIGTFTFFVNVNNGLCDETDSIQITFDPCTGISENGVASVFSLSPNPSNGFLYLESSAVNGSAVISVMSTEGRLVFSRTVSATGLLHETLDLRGLPAGMYYVQLNSENFTATEKVIITR